MTIVPEEMVTKHIASRNFYGSDFIVFITKCPRYANICLTDDIISNAAVPSLGFG